ncbi:hypothetical protein EWM64_g130 [Hericium alpestre]|uniref:Uncharacterized protein n=1 Tax=Hericium alpestre TaxID=135208 RepID=A0A4Z0ABV9_9AGAM|nr:hypothetical protein EWM64_g130 [Hericium alpestre]
MRVSVKPLLDTSNPKLEEDYSITYQMTVVSQGTSSGNSSPANVTLGYGPPTHEELLSHYPAKFTWEQLKTFVNSGDLGLLKRDRMLQRRYNEWAKGIKVGYGSMVNYLLSYRLQWGKPDKLSKLKSRLDLTPFMKSTSVENESLGGHSDGEITTPTGQLPPIPAGTKNYFTADISPSLVSIIQNDWPYSVPANIEHTLIWTVLPILPPDLPPSIGPRLHQDGLWGFTGQSPDSPPPSPSLIRSCLPALAEWGVTEDSLVRSPKGSAEDEELVRSVAAEIHNFVRARWVESDWETAWFVNPPRLQSVPGLAHIHVFARYKSSD